MGETRVEETRAMGVTQGVGSRAVVGTGVMVSRAMEETRGVR